MSQTSEAPGAAADEAVLPGAHAGRDTPEEQPSTRDRILRVATAEFARHGATGTRVERIAAQAQVNVRMIYHYFGSKDDLFLAVLESAYQAIRDAERALALERTSPEEGMRRLIRFSWDYYFAHPEFTALLNSENLQQGRHVARSQTLAAVHSPLLERLTELLARGAREGVFRAGVDPMQIYVSISALGYFYVSNRYTLSAMFQRDLMSPQCLEERVAHITELVLGYLLQPATPIASHAPRKKNP
ncbi:TetR/AcrR family transcriptional regulator [Ramlibacter sp. AN1015]|uniref:TetR/AcrR family transcriptional regulator n=1 Tax=Ramlibacter sp. AN1015 TaxID=3133428 RepID=UPI0030BE6C6B